MGCSGSKAVETATKEAQTELGMGLSFYPSAGDRRPSTVSLGADEGSFQEPKRRIVTHVCLTGGPCAGKSTALSNLLTKLPQRAGIKVFCVPEAATLMVGGGMDWADCTSKEIRIEYQLALLRTQLALEDTFLSIARAYGKPAVVVSDRGTMDGRAFCSEEEFNELLRRGGYTLEQLRDTRYDCVIHMVTAAIGAEQFYNLDNPARMEDKEGARSADERLRSVYIGHRNVKVVDNSATFDAKLDRVYDAVLEACGQATVPHHRTRRYLTKIIDDKKINVPFVHMRVIATVLAGSQVDNVKLLLQRTQGVSSVYIYQQLYVKDGVLIKAEHRISQREYNGLMHQRDPLREDVIKDNTSFMWENSYYECGAFLTPKRYEGQAMMYVDCSEGSPLPPFIEDAVDVTADPNYSTFAMSLVDPAGSGRQSKDAATSANGSVQVSPHHASSKPDSVTSSTKVEGSNDRI